MRQQKCKENVQTCNNITESSQHIEYIFLTLSKETTNLLTLKGINAKQHSDQ